MTTLPRSTMADTPKQTGAGLKWEGVIIHHTASERMSLADCNAWHKKRGFDECGYSFIIQPNGNTQTARGYEKVGAHSKGQNRTHLGVAFVGTNEATSEQLRGFRLLYERIREKYGRLPITGHNEHRATECPGRMHRQIREANKSLDDKSLQ